MRSFANPVTVLLIISLLALAGCQRTQTVGIGTANAASRIAEDMVGQPYRFGGHAPGGFDCSGLVWYSYKKAGVATARTTRDLIKQTKKVSRKKLRRGDLVFFKGWIRTGHVGMYLGRGVFVHAPSSGKKVKISRLDSGYWLKHFKSAGRIID